MQKRLFSTTSIQQISPLTRRLFKLPASPPCPSPSHHDLGSFLTHAHRTNLAATNPVYQGTHYEYTVQRALRRLAFALDRVGGRDDAGVDLVGTWHVPGREHAVRVFVQCKALSRKAAPNLVRELEGSFRGGAEGGAARIGVLVSSREATQGVREAVARSRHPVVWMMVCRDGSIQQVLWNRVVEALGLGRLEAVVRYMPQEGVGSGSREVLLTWDGEEVPHMDQVEGDLETLQTQWLALWKGATEADLETLLDVVQGWFPAEKPLFTPSGLTGTCSTLSEPERERVLGAVRDRLSKGIES